MPRPASSRIRQRAYWLRTTVNCINGLAGSPFDDQSIDADAFAGTENRMYAAPPANTDTFTGDASDSGNTGADTS